jgi:hypothetical protein
VKIEYLIDDIDYSSDLTKIHATRSNIYGSPLSCLPDETVAALSFNRHQVVLAINPRKKGTSRLELRSRGMILLRCFSFKGQLSHPSLVELKLPTEWLFRYGGNNDQQWKYFLIDESMCLHEQKLLSTMHITQIGTMKNSQGKLTFVLTHKNPVQGDTLPTINTLLLKFYQM